MDGLRLTRRSLSKRIPSICSGRRPPNLLKVQILFLKGARDQIGGNLFWSSWSSRPDWICAVNQSRSGKIPSQDSGRPKGQKTASSASVTDVHRLWVSLHRFGISDFRFGISDFEIRISESGFQCLVGNHCHKRANFCLGVKGDFGGAGGLAEG